LGPVCLDELCTCSVGGGATIKMMRVSANFSALKNIRWYEFAVRFLFGGAVTVITGLLAKHYGPIFGGLFLAFPAIFPASATLVEKHEHEKKLRAGISWTIRGRQSAALDARGAAIGSLGLIGFAIVIWKFLGRWSGLLTLCVALMLWLVLSVLIWRFRRHRVFARIAAIRQRAQEHDSEHHRALR
jgi:uncharacterized membrane protein (GlpM family)